MELLPRLGSRKLVLAIFCLFVFLLILRQHNVSQRFVFSGQLSESLKIIDNCGRDGSPTSGSSDEVAGTDLPSIIHQIWRTSDVRTYSTEFEPSHDSWKTMFEPLNYTVKLWTDDEVHELITADYPWLLSTYQSYSQNIQRADLARLAVVHAEGGIYADLDVYPRDAAQVRCLQHLGLQAIFASTRGGSLGLSNHFFMAQRGSTFLQWALYEAKRRGGSQSRHVILPYLRVLWSTGPLMVTAAFREYAWIYGPQKQDVGLLDEDKYRRAVLGHAAGRSWHGLDGLALNYVADHVQKTLLMVALFLTSGFGLVWLAKTLCCGYRAPLAYLLPINNQKPGRR